MIIMWEYENDHSRYTLNGVKVSKGELETRCGKYLSVYGLQSILNLLTHQGKVIVEVDGDYV